MVICAIGGYLSARLARRVPQPVLRGLVVFIGLAHGRLVLLEKLGVRDQGLAVSIPRG